jgi:hypothetical protein
MSTSRIACGLRIFPYGRNIVAVVSAVMNKDRQDAAQKRRASSGSPILGVKRRECGGVQRLLPPAVASRCWLQNRPRPDLARCRRARRQSLPAEPSLPRAELRRSGSCLRRGDALPTSARILAWTTISLVSSFFYRWCVAGSGEGQMVVVPPAVATTASPAVVGVKGDAFCASGEISSAAAVKDEAGAVSRRLREASQQLSQVS